MSYASTPRSQEREGQDAELLPLPRRVRLPVTERLPISLKDALLRHYGHQLAITARKPG